MVRVAFLSSLIVIASVFGGCLEDGAAPAAAAGATTTAAAGNETAADLVNTPPVPVIQVLVNGTLLVADNGTLAAPAGENLTFDASNSTDADGDELTFAWDFDGNGTADNATATYAFAEPGNRTVTLTVTDAGGLAATANVTLVVASGGPAPGTWLREDVQAFGNAQGGTYIAASCNAALSKDWVLVDAEDNGTASAVSKVVVTMAAMTSTGLNAYTKLSFKGPDGKVIKESTSGSGAKKLEIEGPLAAGKYKVEASVCSTYLSTQTNSPAVGGVATYVSV